MSLGLSNCSNSHTCVTTQLYIHNLEIVQAVQRDTECITDSISQYW